MSKQVTIIPAKLNRATFTPLDQPKKRKVAGYARVSTDSEEQQTSYEAQVSCYTEYIQKRDDWEFAGMYTDEGIGIVKECAVREYPKSWIGRYQAA